KGGLIVMIIHAPLIGVVILRRNMNIEQGGLHVYRYYACSFVICAICRNINFYIADTWSKWQFAFEMYNFIKSNGFCKYSRRGKLRCGICSRQKFDLIDKNMVQMC